MAAALVQTQLRAAFAAMLGLIAGGDNYHTTLKKTYDRWHTPEDAKLFPCATFELIRNVRSGEHCKANRTERIATFRFGLYTAAKLGSSEEAQLDKLCQDLEMAVSLGDDTFNTTLAAAGGNARLATIHLPEFEGIVTNDVTYKKIAYALGTIQVTYRYNYPQ